MNVFYFCLLIIVISISGKQLSNDADRIIAAINDNGCASHQPPSPGYKQRIETYNLESLKGNK